MSDPWWNQRIQSLGRALGALEPHASVGGTCRIPIPERSHEELPLGWWWQGESFIGLVVYFLWSLTYVVWQTLLWVPLWYPKRSIMSRLAFSDRAWRKFANNDAAGMIRSTITTKTRQPEGDLNCNNATIRETQSLDLRFKAYVHSVWDEEKVEEIN